MFLEQVIEGLTAYHILIWKAATYWLNVTSHNTLGQVPAGNPRSLNITEEAGRKFKLHNAVSLLRDTKSHSQSLFRIRASSVCKEAGSKGCRLFRVTYRKSSWQNRLWAPVPSSGFLIYPFFVHVTFNNLRFLGRVSVILWLMLLLGFHACVIRSA
jgi:hypothetical protein